MSQIRIILHDGWNISNFAISKRFDKRLYSSIYLVDNFENNKKFVLKKSKISNKNKQQVIFKVLRSIKGLPIPQPIKSTQNKYYFEKGGAIFTLTRFVEGSTFDGSNVKLKLAANELANLHKALKNCQLAKSVRDICGDVYPLDLEYLKNVKFKNPKLNTALKDLDKSPQKIPNTLPKQIGHFDYNPDNILFHKTTEKVVGILDFDLLRYSQTARDVALASHRLSRKALETSGESNLNNKVKIFLSAYKSNNCLSDTEIEYLPALLIDEGYRKIIYLLKRYETLRDRSLVNEIYKQIEYIHEADSLV